MAAAPPRVFISHIHEEAALGAVVSSCIKGFVSSALSNDISFQ